MDEFNKENIGNYLTNRLSLVFTSKRQAGNALAQLIGINSESTRGIVNKYCKGEILINSGGHVKSGKVGSLERLSLFYDLIKLEKEDPIVEHTKLLNPGFEYPPNSKINKAKIYHVHFEDKKYILTKEQNDLLERTAYLFDKANKE